MKPSESAAVGRTILGTDGDDVLHGTNGDDFIRSDEGVDIVHARGGDDTVIVGSDHNSIGDKVFGEKGNDKLSTGSGDDEVDGGAGNDDIDTGDGADVIHAGAGDDDIVAFSNFETEDDTVYGGKGDDSIRVGKGADTVNGGEGNDTIELNVRAPLLPYLARDGADTVIFEYASSGKGFGHDTGCRKTMCSFSWTSPEGPRALTTLPSRRGSST